MRTRVVPVFLAASLAALALAGPATAAPLSHLQPGARGAGLDERVPVNVVFVGFDRGEVSDTEFQGGLPQRYRPVVRSRRPYGDDEELGIDYTYDYNVTHASAAWEDTFFAALKGLAAPAPRTSSQNAYNEQAGTRDVGQNHFIDAPTVEKWLIDNAPAGVDTRRDTIFFVNWWGRSDFIDHVYTKFGEPDPDTGFEFGNQDSRKVIAWGGTTPDDEETGLGARGAHRVWFYDLSAGPERWGASYDITRPDIDGDGAPDYRVPAAWEYADGGYRSPAALAGDLSKVTRYAAINLMFTTSPLFPPYLTPELLPAKLDLDRNTYEGWPGVDASARYQDPAYLLQEESELFPAMPISADAQDLPFQGKARQCYVLWLADAACFNSRPQYPAAADLFVHNALNLEQALDQDVGTRDEPDDDSAGDRGGGGDAKRVDRLFEAPAFNYATDDASAAPFLGYTDDNWLDGTQSFVYGFISPGVVKRGYGLTTTQIHEYGHYFGMSHPHDGFDWETGLDYTATGPLYFAWATDEQNSMMSYIDLNWDFSQFDRDNAARQQAAGYLINANIVAGRVLAGRHAKRAGRELAAADAAAGRARRAMAGHDYRATWLDAREAYEQVLRAAAKAGVRIAPSYNGWVVLPKEHAKDPVRNPIVAYAGFDRIGAGTHRSMP